ncbi:hypothetical protein N2152v2_006929 [Parachlorella kessleri]
MGKHDEGKHRKRKKRRREAESPPPAQLILEAAVGDRRACKQLLKAGAPVGYADPDQNTALHEACRHGHLEVAKLLLKHGARADAANGRGDTPAHLATRHRHLEVLAVLLQSRRPPDIEARNQQGVSIRELVETALEGGGAPTNGGARRQGPELPPEPGWASGQRQGPKRGGAAGSGADAQRARQAQRAQREADSPDSWRQRLAEELSDVEDPSIWGEEQQFSGADECETAEEYAQRIWEEMQARRQAQRDAEMAAFRRRRRDEESRREWARRQAEDASRRVLEEEVKKDSAWRHAVAQGQAGAKRASYEARWQFFTTKHTDAPIHYKDVPWILPQETASQEELQHVVLYGASTHEEKRRRLRSELVRWHPDKFVSKFGARLAEGDRQRVLDRVNATSQLLNALNSSLQQQQA